MSIPGILCWLNASKESGNATLRLVPVSQTPFIPAGKAVFINGLPSEVSLAVADGIRATFGSKSWQMMLDFSAVKVTKSGGLAVEMTSAEFDRAVVEVATREKAPLGESDRNLMNRFGGSSPVVDDDDDLEFS